MADPVSLDEVLAYRHPGIVRRYAQDFDVTQEEAEEIFQETLKWLYLSARGLDQDFSCAMTADIGRLDDMWHTFLLFTRDYAAFCERYLGFFLHHVPNEDEDDPPIDPEAMQQRLERQYGLVYDLLGEPTLVAWYDDCRYAEKVATE